MSSMPQVGQSPLVAGARDAFEKAGDFLLRLQDPEGFWNGALTADTTLESDYILFQLWVSPPTGGVWKPAVRPKIEAAVRSIQDRQNEDGGFGIFPGGASDLSASVKAYFALKLCGLDPASARMTSLKERILALGGIQAANSYTKINLSLFGLYPREHTPSIPPEMMLSSRLIYEMSAWTRAICIPLSIVHTLAAERPVPDGFHLQELFLPDVPLHVAPSERFLSWRNFFLGVDWGLKVWEKKGSRKVREKAIRLAENWMLERFSQSEGLGAIFPAMMYAVMALDVLGYPEDHPIRREALRQFEALYTGTTEALIQPCFSPVWDTANALFALQELEIAPESRIRAAVDWLLSKEVRSKGDWSVKRPDVEPSGWYFEFANEFYPDIDDTGMVVLALGRGRASDSAALKEALQRSIHWLVAMQSKDGGWAAFDVDSNWKILRHVPFADHNAMLDPTCADITGRVLEGLSNWGVPLNHPAIRRGVQYLIDRQEDDGSWFGRWGVNYLYGTFLALRGLRAAGEGEREAHILRAGEWVRSIQNADGGWGEDCESYAAKRFVPAASTPSQTAWAILALLASGDTTSSSLENGIEYLLRTQCPMGTWEERLATGTGFPRVFYLNYHMYRHYFPLLALGAFYRSQVGPLAGRAQLTEV